MAKASEHYRNSEWYRELSRYLEAIERPGITTEQADKISDRFEEACTRIMARPVTSLDDLAILAGICRHWANPDEAKRLDDKSVAYLVGAVLTLAGLELDAEGRVRNL